MSATWLRPRPTRLAMLAITGAIALSIAACSTSNTHNTGKPSTSVSPTSTAPKPPPPPAPPMATVEGLVRSVSGTTIQLTQRDRSPATVDFTPTTMVTELSSAGLTDVKPGSCVDVEAASQSAPPGGSITAQSVMISPAVAGTCPPPEMPGPTPAAAVYGTVASVTGNTIAVNSSDPTGKTMHSTVTVTNTTAYTKHAVTNTQAIRQGKCMAAQGTTSGGVLHAATIDLEPCPPMGGGHRRFHLPHLPHFPYHR
jgi:Domain of unknown function (DUF5666)